MAQPPLTPSEEARIKESLEKSHVKLGDYLKSGGRAHIYRGEDELSFGRVIVRIARKSTVISNVADDGQQLRTLLDGCPQGFMVPVRPIHLDDPNWNISIWDQCDGNLWEMQSRYGIQELLSHFRNLAAALDFLHRNGYMHCDVTPSNILFRNDLARLSDYDLLLTIADDSMQAFPFRGTPGYSAPDFQSAAVTTADLWSLAVCYAEARCHRYPFENKRDPKGPPSLQGMGPEERRVVARALSARHEDRLKSGGSSYTSSSHNLHTEWISALEKAVRDDGLSIYRSELPAFVREPAQLKFGIHGVRESGKTTFLAMTKHPRAGQSTIEKERIADLRVVPAPDSDGIGTSTLEYLAMILEEIRTSGSPQPTNLALSKELRFEVTIRGKRADVIVEDYAGEIVELAPSPGAQEHVPARLDQIAQCDVQLLFVPVDREGEEVQHAVDKLRGYLHQAIKKNPNRPKPVICVVYTKADTINDGRLDINNPESIASFRNWLCDPEPCEIPNSDHFDHVVDPTTIRTLAPEATILPFIVSAYGKLDGKNVVEEYRHLRPVNMWVPFGRAVECAEENLSDWCDGKLQQVRDLLESGRIADADRQLEVVAAEIAPFLKKYPEAVFKIEEVRFNLRGRRQVARKKAARKGLVTFAVLLALASTGGALGFYVTTQKAQGLFADAVANIDQMSDLEFRERHQRRKELLSEWYAAPWCVGESTRKHQMALMDLDYMLIEDADLETMLIKRAELPGPEHARERLDLLSGWPTVSGRHRATYEELKASDTAELEDFEFEGEQQAREHLVGGEHAKERLQRLSKIFTRYGRYKKQYDELEASDTSELEELEFKEEQQARERLAGREHAQKRLQRLANIETRNGKYKKQYMQWEEADREDVYWFAENAAVAKLLGLRGTNPTMTLNEIEKYRDKFSRGSQNDEVSKLEAQARHDLREMMVTAAFDKALGIERENTSHLSVVKGWQEFVSFAGDHPKAEEGRRRIRDRESLWDKEEYASLVNHSLSLAKLGNSASSADISGFVAAAAKYCSADRSRKQMEASVRNNMERAIRLTNGFSQVTLTLESLNVPHWSYFWSSFSSLDATTELTVSTSRGQESFTLKIKDSGLQTYSRNNVVTLPCTWDDSLSVSIVQLNDKSSPGTQSGVASISHNQSKSILLTPAKKGEAAATVTIRMQCEDYDLTRLSLPTYSDIQEAK